MQGSYMRRARPLRPADASAHDAHEGAHQPLAPHQEKNGTEKYGWPVEMHLHLWLERGDVQRVNYKEPNHVANRGTVIFTIARSKRKAVETNQKSDQASVARAFEFPVAGAVSKPDPVAHSVTVPAKCCTNGVSKCETQLIADSSPVNEPDERALRVADQVTYGQPDCVAVTFADTSTDSFY